VSSFISVQRDEIQRAFVLAHGLANCEEVGPDIRRRGREIAEAIWNACGEPKPMPATKQDLVTAIGNEYRCSGCGGSGLRDGDRAKAEPCPACEGRGYR
jgi:hypothetical protein